MADDTFGGMLKMSEAYEYGEPYDVVNKRTSSPLTFVIGIHIHGHHLIQ